MAGYEWKGDLPFRNVYFTGIIRDKKGRKCPRAWATRLIRSS